MTRGLLGWVALGVFVIGLGIVLVVWRAQVPRETILAEPAVSVSPGEMRAAWRSGVREILQEYGRTKKASEARDRLLALRVGAGERDAHLSLVVAIERASQGVSDADVEIRQAQDFFERLPE